MKGLSLAAACAALVLASLPAGFAVGRYSRIGPGAGPTPAATVLRDPSTIQKDLSVGYDLLQWTLANEARVDKLVFVKTITFDRPPRTSIEAMRLISEAAAKTLGEVEEMRKLEPRVDPPQSDGAFGDTLRQSMRTRSKDSLLERSARFPTRLIVSQVQALGLVAAIAEELLKIDSNEQRVVWLTGVVRDYRRMHDVYLARLTLSEAAVGATADSE